MNLLLDTHVALWAVTGHKRLSARARELIGDPANTIAVSATSLWEIAIKHALERKSEAAIVLSARQAAAAFELAGYSMLAIAPAHVLAVEILPAHHSDPFDRLLVAQALSEPLRLVTHDDLVARYSDTIIRV
ncbi:MAG: type II toxin-antitoxin system VapC family toxin [Micropepsaceae bacterium]